MGRGDRPEHDQRSLTGLGDADTATADTDRALGDAGQVRVLGHGCYRGGEYPIGIVPRGVQGTDVPRGEPLDAHPLEEGGVAPEVEGRCGTC
ncbi:hypothetical protein BIV23_03820 [Streptomyces monashensis]|uniref:Uncharacterized protein n=1 Tax=Streptomyces monashensis TaxID=1678012 RepID=A0A1S2QNQ0_9ACTN|nr:hypothetical protein BIV23_03820 [Streptomyces monashensis]